MKKIGLTLLAGLLLSSMNVFAQDSAMEAVAAKNSRNLDLALRFLDAVDAETGFVIGAKEMNYDLVTTNTHTKFIKIKNLHQAEIMGPLFEVTLDSRVTPFKMILVDATLTSVVFDVPDFDAKPGEMIDHERLSLKRVQAEDSLFSELHVKYEYNSMGFEGVANYEDTIQIKTVKRAIEESRGEGLKIDPKKVISKERGIR